MAVWNFYDSFLRDIANGSIDLDTDTIKCMIVSDSYTPSITTHDKRDDVEANEVSGTGYTSGGATLTDTLTLGTNICTYDASDVSWNPVTFTNGRYAILYKSRGGYSSDDELIGYLDFGSNFSPSAEEFLITWDASGIFTISEA